MNWSRSVPVPHAVMVSGGKSWILYILIKDHVGQSFLNYRSGIYVRVYGLYH